MSDTDPKPDPKPDDAFDSVKTAIQRAAGPSVPLCSLSSQHRMLHERHHNERLQRLRKQAFVEDAPSDFTASTLPSDTSSTEEPLSTDLGPTSGEAKILGSTEEMENTINILTDKLVEREATLHQMMYLATSQTANYQDIVQLRARINALESLTDQINFRVTLVSPDMPTDWMQRFLPGALEAAFAKRDLLEMERREKLEEWVKEKVKGFTANVLRSVEKLLLEDEMKRNAKHGPDTVESHALEARVRDLEEKVRGLEEKLQERDGEIVTRKEFEETMVAISKGPNH